MLQRLYIKNIALITEADIEFDNKLNILSGETGSGKSVILDSINFVLGSKADKSMIRYGEQEATVRAEFFVGEDSEAVKKLQLLDIDSSGEIFITRKISLEGKGGIKINGNSVTVSMLKSVTQHLVDVHGQSEHFYLLNEENQLNVIDGLIKEESKPILDNLRAEIYTKKDIKNKISELGGDSSERERLLDLLNFQINEIENADLKVGEFDELKEKQKIVANTEKIIFALKAAQAVINDDGGCTDNLSSAKHYINSVSSYSDEFLRLADRIVSVEAEVSDIAETFSDIIDGMTFDEREAEQIDERITVIKNLKKKYGADEKEILEYCSKAKSKAEAINDSAGMLEQYNARIFDCDKKIYALCRQLTDLRKSAAKNFCQSVTKELKTLNIPDAQFCVEFNEYNEVTANLNSLNGSDEVCFLFSANKGEPVKPLSKVISGGEMSRFMLAIKTILKNINGISTYIFDEIDAGISGFTAKTVAEKFLSIAENTQIIAVSHLPQVCAASTAQFLIFKENESGKTYTKVKRLDENSKIDEIARLAGSVNSQTAKLHAMELIEQFKQK